MFSSMKPITLLIVALCFQPGFGVEFVHHCQSGVATATDWGLWSGHWGPSELAWHWVLVLESGWTCSSVITWSRILFLGPDLNCILGKWLICLEQMKGKQHEEKQRIRRDSKCPINKDGMMVENSKWLDIYLCGPQIPASRVNQLVKHRTGSQSLKLPFLHFFPSSWIFWGSHRAATGRTCPFTIQPFKDIKHYSLKSRRNWEESLVHLAFYTHHYLFRSTQLGISRCSCLCFWIPIWPTGSASEFSTQC